LHQALSIRLANVLADRSAPRPITLNQLLARTEGLSLYLLVILLALPFIIPVSVPGLSPIMGTIITLIALRQGRRGALALPRVLGNASCPRRSSGG